MTNQELCLACSICGEAVELLRSERRDQEKLYLRKEKMAAEHKPCEEWADNPARAKLEREFLTKMRAENKKARRKPR